MYIPVEVDPDGRGAPESRVPLTCRSHPLRRIAALVAIAVGVLAVWARRGLLDKSWLRHNLPSSTVGARSGAPSQKWTSIPHSRCGFAEADIEYRDDASGFGQTFESIPSPDICCAICQAEPKCNAWTWIEGRSQPGEPGRCDVKGSVGTKVLGSYGMVSGTPPQRLQLPQAAPGHGAPNNPMFCISLLRATSGEPDLVKFQHSVQASIFACDGHAVYSNVSFEVAPGLMTKVIDTDLTCTMGGLHKSALNSWVFMALWRKVLADKEYEAYAWVVKSDPDTVFFPDRLVPFLEGHPDVPYFSNCKLGLHGPLEVFGREAVEALAYAYSEDPEQKIPRRCAKELEYGLLREDEFFDKCLDQVLGKTNHPLEPRLLCEDHCDCGSFYWCSEGSDRVSYHPFKSVGAYGACISNAQQDEIPAVIPPENFYFVNAPAPVPEPALPY